MAGKTLIGGTAYTITGGKSLIGGTIKSITGGKTLIGGTVKTISFKEKTITALMSDAVKIASGGRNNSSTGYVSIPIANLQDGLNYTFVFYNAQMSVYKVNKTGSSSVTKSLLFNSATPSSACICTYNTSIYYSYDGTGRSTARGGTLYAVKFPNYTESEADQIISSINVQGSVGANSSKGQKLVLTCPQTSTLFVACAENIAFYSPVATKLFGESNCNVVYMSSSAQYSSNGTNVTSVYGGSILQVD